MAKRSSKRARKEPTDSSNTLKMVLKLSAREHADSLPASPSTSAITHDSDDESAGKPVAKKAKGSSSNQHSPAGTNAKKGGWYPSTLIQTY